MMNPVIMYACYVGKTAKNTINSILVAIGHGVKEKPVTSRPGYK